MGTWTLTLSIEIAQRSCIMGSLGPKPFKHKSFEGKGYKGIDDEDIRIRSSEMHSGLEGEGVVGVEDCRAQAREDAVHAQKGIVPSAL